MNRHKLKYIATIGETDCNKA